MAPKNQGQINEYERVLVVEGHSDLLFYAAMLAAVGKHDLVFIKKLESKTVIQKKAMLEAFLTPKLLSEKSAIAFVLDADQEPQTTRDTMKQQLLAVTKQNVQHGKWTNGEPRIGLFVVPNDETEGEIETLVWKAWVNNPENAAQQHCIENYIACMGSAGQKAHSPAKGLISSLLAIRNDEDPRLGPGARRKIFDLNAAELEPLRVFLAGF